MDGEFIPLVRPAGNGAGANPATDKSAGPGEAAVTFRPLGSPANPPANPAGAGSEKPSITLQRDGDRVTQIRIQCACGQVIELDCLY